MGNKLGRTHRSEWSTALNDTSLRNTHGSETKDDLHLPEIQGADTPHSMRSTISSAKKKRRPRKRDTKSAAARLNDTHLGASSLLESTMEKYKPSENLASTFAGLPTEPSMLMTNDLAQPSISSTSTRLHQRYEEEKRSRMQKEIERNMKKRDKRLQFEYEHRWKYLLDFYEIITVAEPKVAKSLLNVFSSQAPNNLVRRAHFISIISNQVRYLLSLL